MALGTSMSNAVETVRTGGCQCGAVRYEVSGEPFALYVCHCRECQKQSASAFGISLIVRRSNFCLTGGAVTFWSRGTDSGRTLKCAFFPDCGSRLWHETEGESETISIKGGSSYKPVDLGSAIHIWTPQQAAGRGHFRRQSTIL